MNFDTNGQVAIMHQGRLRAVGTSLFLKVKFGKGHTISILSETAKARQVQDIVHRLMPTAEIIAMAAGNTSISLPRAAVRGIPRLFAELMAVPELVKEWGLSNTTLEEVFLRLAAQDHDVNTAIQEVDASDTARVMLMRRPTDGNDPSPDDVVCIMEGPNAHQLVVISPEELMLKTMDDTAQGEDDEESPMMEQFVLEDALSDANPGSSGGAGGESDLFVVNPLNNVGDGDADVAGGSVADQVVAIIWKDTNLAFG